MPDLQFMSPYITVIYEAVEKAFDKVPLAVMLFTGTFILFSVVTLGVVAYNNPYRSEYRDFEMPFYAMRRRVVLKEMVRGGWYISVLAFIISFIYYFIK